MSDFTSWDGNHTPRDRLQHPIPSNLASELRLSAGNHQDLFAFEHVQLQRFGQKSSSAVPSDFELQLLRHHARSFTPTTDLHRSSLSNLSTPSSISVHLPSEQPELSQGHDEVIFQDIPPLNRSICAPEMSLSQTVNSESNRRAINGSSKSTISTKDHPDVIDLTLSDGDVEQLPVVTRDSSPIGWMEPLFTPPPTRRRPRVLMDHVAVPSLPKGTTKAEYTPMPASPGPSVHPTRAMSRVSVCDAPQIVFSENSVSYSRADKGKGRADPPVPISSPVSVPRKKRKHIPAYLGEGVDTSGNALIDAFCTHTVLPLADTDTETFPHWKAIITDSRFTFTRQFNKHMPVSSPDEVGLVTKHHVQVTEGTLVDSQGVSVRVTSADSGCMSLQERPAWELTPPFVSPKIIPGDKHRQTEQTPRKSNPTPHDGGALESRPSKPSLAPFGPSDYPPAISGSGSDRGVALGTDEDVDLNQYFNELGDSPNKQLPTSCEDHTFGSTFTGPLHPNEQLMGLSSFGGDHFLGMPPSPSCGDPGQLPASAPPSVFLAGHDEDQDALLSFRDSHSSNRWSLGNDIGSPGLGDILISQESGTIDPSLLGGEQAAPSGGSTSGGRKQKPRSAFPEPIVYVRRPEDVSGMRGGKKLVQIKFREQESPDMGHYIEGTAVAVPSNSTTKEAKDQLPDDGAGNDSDWLPSGSRVPSASKRNKKPRVSRNSISMVESDLESYVPSAAADVPSISLRSSSDKIRIRLKGPRRPEETTDDIPSTEGKTFCHQCRNTTNRPKMRCSNNVRGGACGKRFCQRCIERRYPDITFDRFSGGFLCPYCTNTCNCSTCSRKRGEDFVSMSNSITGPRIQPTVTVVRRSAPATPAGGDASATAVSGPSSRSAPNFWAHVYGLEGEHLGFAYRKETSNGRGSSKKRPPRVFIGRALESWKVRSVRDLESMPDKVTTFIENSEKHGKGKGKATDPSLRLFIGNRTALHEPFESIFSAPSLASSPLTSPGLGCEDRLLQVPEMEGYWPQPDVGESCVWQPPPLLGLERGLSLPLSDEQVARAIQVALAALS